MDVLFGAITPENRRRDRLVVHTNLMGRVYHEENSSHVNTQLSENKDRVSIHSMPPVLSRISNLRTLEENNGSMTSMTMFPSTTEESGLERNRVWTIPEENITMKW